MLAIGTVSVTVAGVVRFFSVAAKMLLDIHRTSDWKHNTMVQVVSPEHEPVMLDQVLAAWAVSRDGFYIDGTFGRGGHSRALLRWLGMEGRLTGIDQDPDAVAVGHELAAEDARFAIVARRFDCIPEVVAAAGRPLSGVLFDLGVSSPQLDDAQRGFSFLRDGPLDMRMNPAAGESAAAWLARASESDIADVLFHFGEERKSRRIARWICARRAEAPIERTGELAALIEKAIGRHEPGKHPATRSFQAIRIHINKELDVLAVALEQAMQCLKPGGRLAVISFHSLEDRIVKLFIRQHGGRAPRPRGVPDFVQEPACLRSLGRAQRATPDEIARNPRARSAVLRVAEKLDEQQGVSP